MFHTEQREEFVRLTGVTCETLAKLDRYAALLEEWSGKFNLVSASTLPHVWKRHFLDSAQLAPLVPDDAKTLADIGSGAGFPGMVLAIMNAHAEVHLIESTGKKATFLQTVIDDLKLSAKVRQMRAEDIRDTRYDVITARALAPLPELLRLTQNISKTESLYLFLKGQNADSELTESEKRWTLRCQKKPSLSDDSGTVLILKNVRYKNAASHKKHRH